MKLIFPMEQEFKKAKAKAEELGLTPDQIKKCLHLFAYADVLRVEFYLKEADKLGMRKKAPKDPFRNPAGPSSLFDAIFGNSKP